MAFLLSLSFCLSIQVCVCLSSLFFAWLLCLFLLSQSFSSPGPPIHQFTSRTSLMSLPFHHFPHLYSSHIFRPLSTSLPTFSLLSHIFQSQRSLSFYLSSYYALLLSLCTPGSLALPTLSPTLSRSYLPCPPFPCIL